jgi:hypothetical protein
MVDVGAGIQLYRCFSANDAITSPHNTKNQYIENGDTLYYTFAGTKLMGRISFDPKPLVGLDIFGKEDLKLYAEAAILGVKDYPAPLDTTNGHSYGYDKLEEKIPVMFGFNVPVFRVLDVLAMGFEWYGMKYPNQVPDKQKTDGIPVALPPIPPQYPLLGSNYSSLDYANDDWKWSVYAKKTLFGNFSITGQVARDHTRIQAYYLFDQDREDALTRSGQWMWTLKCQFQF